MQLHYGVPHGLVLGPFLFPPQMLSLWRFFQETQHRILLLRWRSRVVIISNTHITIQLLKVRNRFKKFPSAAINASCWDILFAKRQACGVRGLCSSVRTCRRCAPGGTDPADFASWTGQGLCRSSESSAAPTNWPTRRREPRRRPGASAEPITATDWFQQTCKCSTVRFCYFQNVFIFYFDCLLDRDRCERLRSSQSNVSIKVFITIATLQRQSPSNVI